jgi:methylmalonyl-CoA/ethylmalonyl-CoA epimerase
MKALKIDHLGIAVNRTAEARRLFQDILGLELLGTENVEEQKVTTSIFSLGDSEVELLESTSPDGPVARFIEKRGEGIQHLAIQVDNLDAALEELKDKGIRLIDEKPREGVSGSRIAFLHPKSTFGILIELSERPQQEDGRWLRFPHGIK